MPCVFVTPGSGTWPRIKEMVSVLGRYTTHPLRSPRCENAVRSSAQAPELVSHAWWPRNRPFTFVTTLIALLQFPSAEAVQAFVNDPQYAPYAAARKGGSESRFQLIDDSDLAGTIPYLPKG